MKTLRLILMGLGSLLLAPVIHAQERGVGWEFGADLIYQLSQDVDANGGLDEGGSNFSLDDDIGLSINFGYRFSDRLELQFALDWNDVDYDASVVTYSDITGQPNGTLDISGSLESFTPRAAVHYNFVDGPITPYVKAGIGWTFIDTNIPEGRAQTVCWWDPWWGYVCGNVQDTRSVDGFEYELGLGVRWDIGPGYSLRVGYEKHWLDLSEADGTPDLDQFKIGIVYRY